MSSRLYRALLAVVLCAPGVATLAGSMFPSDFESALSAASNPLQTDEDVALLLAAASDARVVMLGEASHGTQEFYTWRDRLSRRLIEGEDIAFVAVEGDSATLAPLDRYVRLHPAAPESARAALAAVEHWPSWVWANEAFADFVEWLRAFNALRPVASRVALYGLDIYAIWAAFDELSAFYREQFTGAIVPMQRLQQRLMPFRGQPRDYTDAVGHTGQSLRPDIQRVIVDLEARYARTPKAARDAVFTALVHARAIDAGLHYLEALPGPPRRAAGVRSQHFGSALQQMLDYHGAASRGIVWAHNTHVGDARGTDARFGDEASLGQLARERLGEQSVFLVGFGSGTGQVIAARRWDGPCSAMPVPVPRADSLEAALFAGGDSDRVLLFGPERPATPLLSRWLSHRAIGVVYDTDREPWVHYVPTRFAERYDAFIFLPRTRALQALDWPSGAARCGDGDALATDDPIAPRPVAR